MTDRERALDYLAVFIKAGECWHFYVPVDGELTPAGVRIGSVELGPKPGEPGVWFLKDGDEPAKYYRARTEVPA